MFHSVAMTFKRTMVRHNEHYKLLNKRTFFPELKSSYQLSKQTKNVIHKKNNNIKFRINGIKFRNKKVIVAHVNAPLDLLALGNINTNIIATHDLIKKYIDDRVPDTKLNDFLTGGLIGCAIAFVLY